MSHVPVLVEPILELLAPRAGQVYLDCTVGLGGHVLAIGPRLAPGGRVIALDTDPGNADRARDRIFAEPALRELNIHVQHANFIDAPRVLAGLEPRLEPGGVDLLLADLGFASNQIDDGARGFSFSAEGPLDMRLDTTGRTTAADLVNSLPERELADLIYQLGEERLSRRIARKIVDARHQNPIETTAELTQIVHSAYGPAGRRSRIDPATRTFMALRIAVNGELEALDALLDAIPKLLRPGGRAGVISFHSLEDRRVKHAFAALAKADVAKRVTKKPVVADDDERRSNPRSRSAKLRVIEMVGGPVGDATRR